MESNKLIRLVAIGVVAFVAIIIFFNSWTDVDPGQEGFVYEPYGDGVDTSYTYSEGTQFIAPWNEMITYNVRQRSKNYKSAVMDKNGTNVTLDISVNFHALKGKTSKLHLLHGERYDESFIDQKVKGAIKDVIGRYTYVEVYSTKRESLEQEIEKILDEDFNGNYIALDFVEIADVDLPENIAEEITVKETQKQKNQTAKEKQKEQEYLANARIEKARGDSALIISAKFKADAIRLEAEQIAKNPQYIELKKWEKWNGDGSPYGEGNVFGNNSVGILKQR